MKKIVLVIAVVLLLSGIAFAAENREDIVDNSHKVKYDQNEPKNELPLPPKPMPRYDGNHDNNDNPKQFIQPRYDNINCHVQFAITAADNMVDSNKNFSDLNNKISELQAKLSELLSIADSNSDKRQFNEATGETWKSIQSLNQQIKDNLDEIKGPGKKQERQKLRGGYSGAKQVFLDCKKNSNIQFAKARLDSYKRTIGQWQEKITRFNDKNIDTTEMNNILSQAQTSVVAPLETAIATGDYNTIVAAVKENCLFNGCDGINFHLDAKIEIAKLNAILAKIKDKATTAGLTAQWQNAQDSVTAAKTALDSVGTQKYTEETKKAVWNNIKDCAKKIRQLFGQKEDNQGGNEQ